MVSASVARDWRAATLRLTGTSTRRAAENIGIVGFTRM
jgi:hypothetical protein